VGPHSGFVQTGCGGQDRTGLELAVLLGNKTNVENSGKKLQEVAVRWRKQHLRRSGGGGVRRKDSLMRKFAARWRGVQIERREGGKQVEEMKESAREIRLVTYESTVDYWTRREGEPKRNTCWKNRRKSDKCNGSQRVFNFRYHVLVVCLSWRRINGDDLIAVRMENEVSICENNTVECKSIILQ
jgi:hypothetical protein